MWKVPTLIHPLRRSGFRYLIWIFLGTVATIAAGLPKEKKTALQAQVEAQIAALPETRVKAALSEILGLEGTPYKWGGDDLAVDGGYDCVGLVYHLYHKNGLEFPLARYSSLNMTPVPRSPQISKRWWNDYSTDFEKTMISCLDKPFESGDVLVYHKKENQLIVDRTGHVVVVVDPAKGLALSAARSGVSAHSLGNLKSYDGKGLTACWRAPSAQLKRRNLPAFRWRVPHPKGSGTLRDPFPVTNPVQVSVTFEGPPFDDLTLDITSRVNSLIGAVYPTVSVKKNVAPLTTLEIRHDYKSNDLPVDPGESIKTPLRKIIVRLLDPQQLVVSEFGFYVKIQPYPY
jgi:hypothetical protein